MNAWLLLVLLPSLIIAIVMAYRHWPEVSWLELGAQALICLALVGGLYSMSLSVQTQDTEFLNGRVVSKERDSVTCSHTYSCNCRSVTSGSGKHRHTRRVCDTCRKHSSDYDWNVDTTVGRLTIDRVNSSGSQEPERWSAVRIGEPATVTHGYTNWIKAAPQSLYHTKIGEVHLKTPAPDYPTTHDYYHADRVIAHGVSVPDIKLWNSALEDVLSRIGAPKQANAVIVLTNEGDSFAEVLRGQWIGGKKNDVIVVIGVDPYPKIKWVRVFSWSKFDLVNVSIRSDLLATKIADPIITTQIIERNVMQHYQRRSMKEFEYLAGDVSPPGWALVLFMLIGAAASFFLSRYFATN